MKLEPKQDSKIKWGHYCASCGSKVPLERKYLTEFFQREIAKDRYAVHFSYICPKCNLYTSKIQTYPSDIDGKLEEVDLYGHYARGE